MMDDNKYDSDGFTAQLQEEYDVCAGEESIDIDEYNDDGQTVLSSSDIEESFEVSTSASTDG